MPCSMHLHIQARIHFGILWRANLESCCRFRQELHWFRLIQPCSSAGPCHPRHPSNNVSGPPLRPGYWDGHCERGRHGKSGLSLWNLELAVFLQL
jgi:hypothetical protein